MGGGHRPVTDRSLNRMVEGLFIFAICSRDWPRLRSRRRVEKGEVETHAPVGTITGAVRVVLTADLYADGLFSNLQDLADLEDERHGPFRVARCVVPIRC